MKVVLDDSFDPPTWGALAAADDAATIFHQPRWLEAVAAVYREFRPHHLLVRDDSGRLLGGLPGIRARRAGLTQILSLPFGSYGTPLLSAGAPELADRIYRTLLEAWTAAAGGPGVVRAHLAPFFEPARPSALAVLPESWRREERTHLIRLEQGFETIWFKHYDKENRTASRKAMRSGVVVAVEEGTAAAEILDRLYRSQAREWTWPWVYRYGLFHQMAERLGPMVRVWVAWHQERPVFALMVFYHKSTVFPWVSGAAREARGLCAGNLVHKVVIEDGCSRSYSTYNFGSSGGVPGIEAFKVAFGGEPVDYHSYLRESALFGRVRLARQWVLGRLGRS